MNMNVLVADDSSFIRALIVDTLRDLGVTDIKQAADGREALTVFRRQEFDLIVIDWQMPRMSGLEVVEAIRAAGHQMPILMVTATGTARENVIDAVRMGVSDYLLKPFNPATLRDKLAKYCLAMPPSAAPA